MLFSLYLNPTLRFIKALLLNFSSETRWNNDNKTNSEDEIVQRLGQSQKLLSPKLEPTLGPESEVKLLSHHPNNGDSSDRGSSDLQWLFTVSSRMRGAENIDALFKATVSDVYKQSGY
jgi:hypothetical protein